MGSCGFTVEVTGLSPNATEKDVYNFFAFSGTIENVEIVRSGEYACTAYVTFKEARALDTAVLLSGATIVDQRVCITRWGQHDDEFGFWNRPSWKIEEETGSSHYSDGNRSIPSAGEAASVVKAMLAKGYVLGKDALSQAKAFDESYHVSATAAATVADFNKRVGLTDKIQGGVGAVRSVDEKYGVTETTKAAVSATGKTAVAAANTVISSTYFSNGALWVSNALHRAAKVAADLGNQGSKS